MPKSEITLPVKYKRKPELRSAPQGRRFRSALKVSPRYADACPAPGKRCGDKTVHFLGNSSRRDCIVNKLHNCPLRSGIASSRKPASCGLARQDIGPDAMAKRSWSGRGASWLPFLAGLGSQAGKPYRAPVGSSTLLQADSRFCQVSSVCGDDGTSPTFTMNSFRSVGNTLTVRRIGVPV